METALGIAIVADLYALVYYRLLARWFLEKDSGVRESALGAIFTLPPWNRLSSLGRKYARRYYVALAIMATLITAVAAFVGLPRLPVD